MILKVVSYQLLIDKKVVLKENNILIKKLVLKEVSKNSNLKK